MKITYIWHDCFVVETTNAVMIFDYWKDPEVGSGQLPRFVRNLPAEKDVFVFVSHFHKDHFNPEIFEWQQQYPRIRYFISRDTARHARHMLNPESIYRGYKPRVESVRVLRPLESCECGGLTIRAFASTDTGNSWLVEADGKTYFHAGDLNAWVWMEESTKKEIEAAIRDFRNILNTVKEVTDHIDYAMFPVDARLGKGYWTGASIFVREMVVDTFLPMHFGLGEDAAEQKRYQLAAADFDKYANPDRGEYIALQSPYAAILRP